MCTFMYTCSDTKDSNMDIQVPVTSKSSQQRGPFSSQVKHLQKVGVVQTASRISGTPA